MMLRAPMTKSGELIRLSLLIATVLVAGACTRNVREALARVDPLWPVEGSSRDRIDSTFGPRLKRNGDYDWHRGIDIPKPNLAEPNVLAAVGGTVRRVAGSEVFTNGGNTVVLEHRFSGSVEYTPSLAEGTKRHCQSLDW